MKYVLLLFLILNLVCFSFASAKSGPVISEESKPPTIDHSKVSLKITGYDWVEFSQHEKLNHMIVIFDYYELDSEEYDLEKGIEYLDIFYYLVQRRSEKESDFDKNTHLNKYCFQNLNSIVEDKETDRGIKSLTREIINNKKIH